MSMISPAFSRASAKNERIAGERIKNGRILRNLPVFLAIGAGLLIIFLRGAAPFAVNSDHAFFLPVSWWFVEHGQLANPWILPDFNGTFNWHGFLQPWLIGALAGRVGGGWSGVYCAVNLLAAINIVAAACCARALGVSPLRACALTLIVLALMLDARARPEVLATLETLLLVYLLHNLAVRFPHGVGWAFGIGVLCAALGVTHPVVCIFSCFAVAIALAVLWLERRPSVPALLPIAAAMLLGFLSALAIAFGLIYPEHITFWLDGIGRAGALVLARTDTGGLLYYYFFNRFLPGFAIAFIPAGLTIWAFLRPAPHSPQAAARWALLALTGLGGAWLVYRFALRIPATYYNVTGLLAATCLATAIAPLSPQARRMADIAVGCVCLGALLGAALWTTQEIIEQPSIARSRSELAAAISSDYVAGRRICADPTALSALDSPDLARAVTLSLRMASTPPPPDSGSCDVFYALQSQNSQNTPPVGYLAAQSTRQPNFMMKLGLRPADFGYTRWVAAPRP